MSTTSCPIPLSAEDAKASEAILFGGELGPYLDSVKDSLTYRFSGLSMVVMSELSDAQELMAMGHNRKATQTINRARFLLTHSTLVDKDSPENQMVAQIAVDPAQTGSSSNPRDITMYGRDFGPWLATVPKSEGFQTGGLALFLDRELNRASELLAVDGAEQARQTLNCVKRLLIESSGPRHEREAGSEATAHHVRLISDVLNQEEEPSAARRIRP